MIHKKIIDSLLNNEAEHFTVYGLITSHLTKTGQFSNMEHEHVQDPNTCFLFILCIITAKKKIRQLSNQQ